MSKKSYTPYQEWLALRKLVSDNNKDIRSCIFRSNGNICDIPEAYKVIAEYFFEGDKEAYLVYMDKCQKNWQDDLSTDELFRLFNFQNNILSYKESLSIGNIESICYNANKKMSKFDKIVNFGGKPKKCEKDGEIVMVTMSDILTDQVEDFCDKNFVKKNIKIDFDIFDSEKLFNLGGYKERVESILKEREFYKSHIKQNNNLYNGTKKGQSGKKDYDETPCFPEFEEFLK